MLQSPPPSQRESAPQLFALRAALLFCAPMLVNGIGLPYFPVFLEYLKMTDAEIGIIIAMPHLVRMIGTPLGAIAADRARDRSVVLVWSAAISLATALALFLTHSFWAVLIIYALQGIAYAPYVPVAEAILITGVRRWGYDYGLLRMWGSIAFIFATLGGGWLFGLFGGAMVLPSMAAFFTLTILMGLAAPRLGKAPSEDSSHVAGAIKGPNPLWRPDFLLVIIGAALVQGSHGMLFAFASIYWTGLGFTGTQIGFLWTAGVIAEIVLFFVSGRLLSRFGIWSLIMTGSLFGVIRWVIFPMPMGYLGHMILQCSHAFTFAIIHVSIQRFMMTRVGEKQEASAQGFYTTFTCLFNALTTFASGYIYSIYSVHGFYWMSIVAGMGVLSIVIAMVIQPQSARSGGKTSESR